MRKIIALVTVTALFGFFQNCAQVSTSGQEPAVEGSEKIVGETSRFDRIVFDSNFEIPVAYNPPDSPPRLSADLVTGQMVLAGNTAYAKSCNIDAGRLESLRAIVETAKICNPPSLSDDMVACLAIGLADIQLSNKTETVELRPVICHSGTYLCDGMDEVFRALLKDLRDRPPVSCQ